jgi:ribokinase
VSDQGAAAAIGPLCVIGDFAWDVLIRTNSELLRGGDTFGDVVLMPGGSAANVAVWAARCGVETAFVGKIGRDRMGQLAQENLELEQVEAHLVEDDSHPTGSVAVFVDHTGERSMVSGHGADFYLLPSELPRLTISRARHVHLTAWSFFTDPPRTAARRAAKLAQESGATLSFDPGSFQMIYGMGVDTFIAATNDLGIDVFLPNKEEGSALTGAKDPEDICRDLTEIYPTALVILKLDADGAMVWSDGEAHHIPPATNNLVDATGAGDSFAGAFLARHLAGADPIESARFATCIAAWVIEHPGARPTPDARLRRLL